MALLNQSKYSRVRNGGFMTCSLKSKPCIRYSGLAGVCLQQGDALISEMSVPGFYTKPFYLGVELRNVSQGGNSIVDAPSLICDSHPSMS
jgi:hypothetical protein